MRRKKKQQRLIAAAIALVVIIAAFFALRLTSSRQTTKNQTTTVTVGSIGPDVQVWQHIAKSSQAKKLGLKIKVKAFTDGPSLLRATSDGSINVSAFASWAYLEAYNKSKSNTGQQVALATTYLEPMGIYSSKYKKLSDLPKGATIALANNAANEARGLLLLQSAGLIKLKKNFDSASGNTNDIVSNPKKFKFKLIDDTTGPRIIKSVDAVLIGNTIALGRQLERAEGLPLPRKDRPEHQEQYQCPGHRQEEQEQCRLQEAGQALPQQADPEVDRQEILRHQSRSQQAGLLPDRLKKLSRLAQLFAFLPY